VLATEGRLCFRLEESKSEELRVAIIEVKTDITGSVWKILKRAGESVAEDEPILILESMKMEIPVASPEPGVIDEVLVKEGDTVGDGTVVVRVHV
jgi:acetyl-CoA carboxylase biotin carboxyl carrier protein